MNFPTKEEVRTKIAQLKDQGYDRIQLPGGTSKDGTYCSSLIKAYYDPATKGVFFVGMPYDSNYYKRNEANGHTKKLGETPLTTAKRELFEETGLTVLESKLVLLEGSTRSVPDRTDSTKLHHKYFFLVEECTGQLYDFEGPNVIDGETAAPLLIPSSMINEVLFKNHISAVLESVSVLSCIDSNYAYALMNIN